MAITEMSVFFFGMTEDANVLSAFASAELPQLKLLHLLHPRGSQTALPCLGEACSVLWDMGV